MEIKAVAGIDPVKKRCVAVGENSAETLMEFLADGLIIVPVTVENACSLFGADVSDVYAIALVDQATTSATSA